MQWRNTETSYGSVAKSFHWLMFLLVAGLLAVGFIMTGLPRTPDTFKIYGLHKSIGILVLMLVALRLAWRLRNVQPRLPDTLTKLMKLGAEGTHWMLYVLLFAMPLTGWLMSSAAGFPVSFFGLFVLPDLTGANRDLQRFFREAHGWLAWALLALVTLHVAAALVHHFYFRDNTLTRMLPRRRKKDAAPPSV